MFSTRFDLLGEMRKRTLCEIAITGLATLVHEFLHVKFENRGYNRYAEEAIVRKLEAQHMREWGEELEEDIATILSQGLARSSGSC